MTEQQRKFCINFVQSRNTVKAALEAGYSVSYSKSRAYELLRNPEIATEVDRLENEYYIQAFKKLVIKGLNAIEHILESEDSPAVKLKAAEMILQRSGLMEESNLNKKMLFTIRLPPELEGDIG